MSTRRRPTDERRREILRAATELIGRDGLAGLTAATLAQAIGVTPGALYKHFESLDEVLEALALEVEGALEASLPPEHLAPADWLERFVEQRRSAVGASRGVLRLLLSDRFSTAFPADAQRALSRAVGRTLQAVTGALVRGQARGEVRRDVAPEALAPLVLGLTQFLAFAGVAGVESSNAGATEALLRVLSPVSTGEPSKGGRRST